LDTTFALSCSLAASPTAEKPCAGEGKTRDREPAEPSAAIRVFRRNFAHGASEWDVAPLTAQGKG
jgi:hypothetical protein